MIVLTAVFRTLSFPFFLLELIRVDTKQVEVLLKSHPIPYTKDLPELVVLVSQLLVLLHYHLLLVQHVLVELFEVLDQFLQLPDLLVLRLQLRLHVPVALAFFPIFDRPILELVLELFNHLLLLLVVVYQFLHLHLHLLHALVFIQLVLLLVQRVLHLLQLLLVLLLLLLQLLLRILIGRLELLLELPDLKSLTGEVRRR